MRAAELILYVEASRRVRGLAPAVEDDATLARIAALVASSHHPRSGDREAPPSDTAGHNYITLEGRGS